MHLCVEKTKKHERVTTNQDFYVISVVLCIFSYNVKWLLVVSGVLETFFVFFFFVNVYGKASRKDLKLIHFLKRSLVDMFFSSILHRL